MDFEYANNNFDCELELTMRKNINKMNDKQLKEICLQTLKINDVDEFTDITKNICNSVYKLTPAQRNVLVCCLLYSKNTLSETYELKRIKKEK